jgi:branched-chain amino acid aminotransferase
MEIKVTRGTPDQLKQKPTDESKLGFGSIFTDHMFLMEYEDGKGWFNPRIEPYRALDLDPAALGIHYAQVVFEATCSGRKKTSNASITRLPGSACPKWTPTWSGRV